MIFYNKYKKFRIENNIDLKDISKRTKIDLKYLQALERGKFAEIPPVYVKLFFKAYINEIGVDINEALFEFDSFLNQILKIIFIFTTIFQEKNFLYLRILLIVNRIHLRNSGMVKKEHF